MSTSSYVPVAAVQRNGREESVHYGAFVALAADGRVIASGGDADAWIFPRSAWKPLQGVGMVRAGLSLSPTLLAVVCASHSGTETHTDLVHEVLRRGGFNEEALANETDVPLGAYLRHEVPLDTTPSRVSANCSGKHAGMLVTCATNGWPWHDGVYLHEDHPLQRAISEASRALAGTDVAPAGRDGCGAPTVICTLRALANGYRAIALGGADSAERAVFEAIVNNPEACAGKGRVATDLMKTVPDLMAKDGAEGVFAAVASDGRALALKVADGSTRPWRPVLAQLLGLLGLCGDWADFTNESAAPRCKPCIRGSGMENRLRST